ncbi:MAG: DoxX family protein [Flavisolibacter sp.]
MSPLSQAGRLHLSEKEKKAKWIKTARWIYWILTIGFGVTMLLAGIFFLAAAPNNVQNILHLGYPLYVLKILGVAKLLGAIAILWGRYPLLKEWAYVGYAFCLMGAAASHWFRSDSFGVILIPLVILLVVFISYKQWKTGWM